MHYPPFIPRPDTPCTCMSASRHRCSLHDRLPISESGQFGEDVVVINALAPARQLHDAALRRITAAEDLLQLMEESRDRGLLQATARFASALAPLVSEARQLYELALERSSYQSGRAE